MRRHRAKWFWRRLPVAPRPAPPPPTPENEGIVEALTGLYKDQELDDEAAESWARYTVYGDRNVRPRLCECRPRERIPHGDDPEICYRCSGRFDVDAPQDEPSDDVGAWLRHGIDMGWCSEVACVTHDGLPNTEAEDQAWEDGYDPCVAAIRLWNDEVS